MLFRSQPHVHVTATRGRYTRTLVQVSLEETSSIALHPATGRLCFTSLGRGEGKVGETAGGMAQLECANMDGGYQAVLWRDRWRDCWRDRWRDRWRAPARRLHLSPSAMPSQGPSSNRHARLSPPLSFSSHPGHSRTALWVRWRGKIGRAHV